MKAIRLALLGFFLSCALASIIGAGWLAWKFGVSGTAVVISFAWAVSAGLALTACQRRWWTLLAVIAVGLRLGMLWITHGNPSLTPDPHYYATLAQHLSHGRDFTDVVDGVQFRAHAPRLYSYLLTAFYFLTDGAKAAPLLLNTALDAGTATLIFLTARRIGAGQVGAAIAAALYLVWPHVVVQSVFAQKESLACALIMACVWTLASERRRPVQYGVCLGLLGMTQPAFFLMAAIFPVALLTRERWVAVARYLAIAAAVAVAALVPQTIRNWYATGGFAPLGTGAGMNLYINAVGAYQFPDQFNHLPEAEWSRAMLATGVAVIASDPIAYAAHQAKAMSLAFALEHAQLWVLQGVPGLRTAPTDFLLVMQVPLIALWGAAVGCLRRRPEAALMLGILALGLVYTFAIGIWFEFGARHRAWMLPVILTFAATLGRDRAERP